MNGTQKEFFSHPKKGDVLSVLWRGSPGSVPPPPPLSGLGGPEEVVFRVRGRPFWGGFVIESPHAGTFRRFFDTTAIILAVEITEERYAALEATLEAMWARREQFSYNLGGLLLAYFHILWKRSNRYYCSEFVEDMLLHAEVRGAGELRARVVQPIHFLKLPHTRLYTGRLRDYPHCTASR